MRPALRPPVAAYAGPEREQPSGKPSCTTKVAQLKARIGELRDERNSYRTTNEIFTRALHTLTVECVRDSESSRRVLR